ncbi:MAG: hypothetical protein OXG11_07645 [Chloroflexi bacterium]|nr:hypothetical protein [Chloroflexota bacterium]
MPSRLTGHDLVRLKNSVVADFNDSNWRELGALTNALDEVERHPRLLRSLSWGDDDYDGLALTFLRRFIGPNDENLSVVLDYVNTKCTSTGDDVSSEQTQGRKIVFSPNLFQIPNEPLEHDLVSVMMPFDMEFSATYEAIKGACSHAGLRCLRADDIWDHSTVMQDVFSLIFRSFVVVCDFSSKNANVLYEAGIAHTLGRHVVPMTQSEGDVPFDLRHHRFLTYLNNDEGRAKLTDELAKRLSTLVMKSPPSPWL